VTTQLLAAVDLGSNSFRLEIGRIEGDRVVPIDTIKDTVRFGAGFDAEGFLQPETCARALAALARFGERLRGFAPGKVRAVGTNALRVARNAQEFLPLAERALGFPIEIIAGREEARLVYLGVSHTLAFASEPRLVFDIGGGSTEFIIGRGYEAEHMESLPLGCVTYTLRYFGDHRYSAKAFQKAELAARSRLEEIASDFNARRWRSAYASSGTARALAEILERNGWSREGITPAGLALLRERMIHAGDARSLLQAGIAALKPERAPVLAGGLAIMSAILSELTIEQALPAGGALRLGVLYDLLGRFEHADIRETTVLRMNERFGVDNAQATRVAALAEQLLEHWRPAPDEHSRQLLRWAASWHEVGRMVAHDDYHKHGAYVLEHADLPGFSTGEQRHVGRLVLSQRGNLRKLRDSLDDPRLFPLVLALRLAVIFAHSRRDLDWPPLSLRSGRGPRLKLARDWLDAHPLTAFLLEAEALAWRQEGIDFRLETP
jgi:exopolyphosphatase/guanosine-5'-triphosphate,3'-diphosphate pyrophosphatase